MNQEKNKNTLYTALKKLPDQPVREELWGEIEQRLLLQESLQELPNRIPTSTVWEGIEQQLNKDNRTFYLLRRIAAAAILIIGFGLGWSTINFPAKATLTYTQEKIDQRLIQVDWHTEVTGLEELETLCQQQEFACANSIFKKLQVELKDLESAKHELVTAINVYGKDAALIVQLKDLEIERTTVIREMYQSLL